MKNNIFPVITFAGAIAALFVLPVNPGLAGFLFAIPGLVALFAFDACRSIEPTRVRAGIAPFKPSNSPSEDRRAA
jgi:hypothetical protein